MLDSLRQTTGYPAAPVNGYQKYCIPLLGLTSIAKSMDADPGIAEVYDARKRQAGLKNSP